MNRENPTKEPTIEAEVVEIDGVAVESRSSARPSKDAQARRETWSSWGHWQGRVKTLDARWWPLWLVLGFVALVLIVAIGMCAAVLGAIYWICKSILLGIVSLIAPSTELQRR